MKLLRLSILIACFAFSITAQPNQPQETYPPHPDSQVQPGVPKGEIIKYTFENSKIFPGTWREYWVYVPAQYTPDKPACVYVNQDGVQYKAPEVFDKLIHNKEMPVTIGIFVMHGRVKAPSDKALDRFNRSYEYDGLGDNYVNFLLKELLPDDNTVAGFDNISTGLETSATHLVRYQAAADRALAAALPRSNPYALRIPGAKISNCH